MNQPQWTEGAWFNEPEKYEVVDGSLVVQAKAESDLWRTTSYGFIHNSAHALLFDFPDQSGFELSFLVNFAQQFDQAGLLIRSDDEHWTKAGIEYCDGAPQIGAVVTNVVSDWSAWPVPEWFGKEVTFRASRSGDAITIRAKYDGNWNLVRVLPIDPLRNWSIGAHCAAPVVAGLTATFTSMRFTAADESLH
ncbi:MAG: DUF1349 domain-containing protein [Actinomycetes bacterium]